MKLSEMYAEYFANWVSDGLLVSMEKISLLGIKPLYDRFYTHGWINKVWAIVKLPVEYNVNITQKIRNETFADCPGVKTAVMMYNVPVRVNVHNDMFVRQFHKAEGRYNDYKEFFDNLSDGEQMTGSFVRDPKSGRKVVLDRKYLDRLKQDYLSYAAVYNAVNAGQEYCHTYYFVQASARTRREMNVYRKKLKSLLHSDGITFVEIHGTVSQYLDNFCPAAYVHGNVGKFPCMLFSQENCSALVPTKVKGLVNETGILAAVDWESKLPFFIDFFGSGYAQIVMLLGSSGCGKTFFAFFLAVTFAAYGVHFSAVDIKGSEWTLVDKYVDICEVSMSGPGARFINTLRLDDVQCTDKDCIDFFEMSVSGTVAMFEIATNLAEGEGNIADLRAILSQAVMKLYNMNGVVKDNPETFIKTRSFRYADVLNVITGLRTSKTFTPKQREICNLIVVRCSPYFLAEGMYSASFQNELTIREILDSPGVVYNLNKNSGDTLDTLDNLKVMMAQFADGKKSMIRKRQKKHMVAFYEELQRCDRIGTLVENISANVTGSRSNNLTVFLLLNAVSTFNNERFGPIRSNITTKIIGKVTADDEKILAEHYGCRGIQDKVAAIREDENGEFEHCFAIAYDTGNQKGEALLKTVIPDDMVRQFMTRDIKEVV